jgi:hypothetical protein
LNGHGAIGDKKSGNYTRITAFYLALIGWRFMR